jgi:diguanylate cyclase (GGDEF)-like protein
MTCGLILSAVIFKFVYDLQVNVWKKEFENQSEKSIINLKAEMKINERILLDILSFFGASPKVTHKTFRSFVSLILERNSFIQALEWAPYVPLEKRSEFENRAKSEGFSNYQFTELLKKGTLVKAGSRPEYFPVYFVEPYAGNESAHGFDLASEAERLKTIVGSKGSGGILATNKVTLVQGKNGKDGLLVFAPFYGNITDSDSKLKGFVLGVYRLDEMVNDALAPYLENGMNLIIYDGKKTSNQNKIFRSLKAGTSLVKYEKKIEIFGRSWVVVFHGDKDFQGGVKLHPSFASAGGLLLFFLLISIAFELNDSRTRHKLLSESKKRFEKLSNLDSLTGLANRRHFDKTLEKEMRRSVRDDSRMSLILLDVDRFKEYNDTHGHLVGDECLKEVAEVLLKSTDRSHDFTARFGGEEFAVILPNTDLDGGLIIAERLRLRIEERGSSNSKIPSITISLGLVATSKDQKYITSKALIAQADKALYEAKEQGRNRTVHFEFPVPAFPS